MQATSSNAWFCLLPTKPSGKALDKEQYFQNIDDSNKKLQKQQLDAWDEKRRGNAKGVEAGEALKK